MTSRSSMCYQLIKLHYDRYNKEIVKSCLTLLRIAMMMISTMTPPLNEAEYIHHATGLVQPGGTTSTTELTSNLMMKSSFIFILLQFTIIFKCY